MNKHKKFIKDCYEGKHGEMCSTWKDTILKHYPEFKEEDFKVGDWVFYNSTTYKITGFSDNNDPWVYGLRGDTENGYKKSVLRKATKEEIEKHLIKEAEKRGFKCGVQVKGLLKTESMIKAGLQTPFEYVPNKDVLRSKEYCIIYEKGIWAEIIETITKKEAEKQLGKKII